MHQPAPRTIDLLILDTLSEGKVVTPGDIAATWGEDRTRVYEWLERFRKRGLCNLRNIPGRGRTPGKIAYLGDPATIAEYLASRTNGAA